MTNHRDRHRHSGRMGRTDYEKVTEISEIMRLHKEGFKIIPWAVLIVVMLNAAALLVSGISPLFWVMLVLTLTFLLLTFWFFRDPRIVAAAAPGEVLSSADGEVVVIEPVKETEYFNAERIQVSVFMSVFNVHINHIPVSGEIVYQKHHTGKFMPANLAKSSGENERCTTVVRTTSGEEVLIRQIAGLVARRIVTYKKTGDRVTLRDQLGFIRFGSRVDLFFPVTAKIMVKPGQKVLGGVTVMAKF